MKRRANDKNPNLGLQQVISNDEEETFALAEEMASGFKGNEVVCLSGELGAGKTVFAKGLAAGLGLKNTAQVCSPSFTIINIYQARCTIFHIDLYRLGKESEIVELGLEDYLDEGVLIIEWAEKMERIPGSILINITMLENDKRRIKITQAIV